MAESGRALLVGKVAESWSRRVAEWPGVEPAEGEVVVRVEWSGINYKDGLAASEKGRVARIDPLVPGVDLAGTVTRSRAAGVAEGDAVVVHGYDLGVARHGGYATHAVVPGDWIVPMPAGLDARGAMTVGTAGYTAALSVAALERAGLRPGTGPVLVTGATGGVGSMAVAMLARLGHEVVASTGKADAHAWLTALGATRVVGRKETAAESPKPLERETWAGAVDCVGGTTLAYALRTCRYGASVAASGLTGGVALATTVMPFILRGVNLLGIDSVQTPIARRREVWGRIGGDLRPADLASMGARVVGLDDLPAELDRILRGEMRGRVLVDPHR